MVDLVESYWAVGDKFILKLSIAQLVPELEAGGTEYRDQIGTRGFSIFRYIAWELEGRARIRSKALYQLPLAVRALKSELSTLKCKQAAL